MKCALIVVGVLVIVGLGAVDCRKTLDRPRHIVRRSASDKDHAHSPLGFHNHMSRKVFERACAASKDTIDEIIACITGNPVILKMVDPKLASNCYEESFGAKFDPKDMTKHKEMICNNRDKFENLTACIYRKTTETVDHSHMEKLTEAMVDVGMCIINALDS